MIVQINMQEHYGGGETYTLDLARTLNALDYPNAIISHPNAQFWNQRIEGNTTVLAAHDLQSALKHCLTQKTTLFIIHTGIADSEIQFIKANAARIIRVLHMPQYGRNTNSFIHYDLVIGVSAYVNHSILEASNQSNYPNIYPHPTYAIAKSRSSEKINTLSLNSIYEWDERKYRDRLGKMTEPLWRPMAKCLQAKNIGDRKRIQLGIVSRITPIKQFPQLFKQLVPILAEYGEIGLDIYGAGGYRSVRDLKTTLLPIADKVRWFGFQTNPAPAYEEIDYLLLGLPEKEALGINVLEANAYGVPSIAINASPFTETVVNGKTGLLYLDPRQDNGKDFRRLIESIQHQKFVTQMDEDWLQKFSETAFIARWRNIIDTVNNL